MAMVNTTPDVILDRIVARLRGQIDDCGEANCYISLDPDNLAAGNPADFIYVVSPGPQGNFRDAYYVGGENNQATVDTIMAVTIHSIAQNDEVGRDREFLSNQARGIINRATLVLNALSGHMLLDDNDNEILADPLIPADYALERQKRPKGSFQLGFSCVFDWNIATS